MVSVLLVVVMPMAMAMVIVVVGGLVDNRGLGGARCTTAETCPTADPAHPSHGRYKFANWLFTKTEPNNELAP